MFPLWVNIVLLLLSLLLLSILIFLVKEKVFLSLLSSHYSTAQYPFQVWMGLWWNQWLYWFGFGERYSLSYLRSYFASSPEMICFIDSLQLEKGEKEKEKEISLGDKIMRTTLRKLWLAEPPMNHFGKIYFQVSLSPFSLFISLFFFCEFLFHSFALSFLISSLFFFFLEFQIKRMSL